MNANTDRGSVPPAGLEHQQNQSPVADITGNDVSPSGLFVNFKNRIGHIARVQLIKRHCALSQHLRDDKFD